MHVLPLCCAKQRKYKQRASPAAVVSIDVLFHISWLSDVLWTAVAERRLRWHLVVRYKPNNLSSQWCDIESRMSEHWLAHLSQHPQLWETSSVSGSARNPTSNLSAVQLHRRVHRKLRSHRYSCWATFSAQSTRTESACTCPFAADTLTRLHWLCLHLRGFNRFFSTLLARRFLLSPEKSRSLRIQRLMNFCCFPPSSLFRRNERGEGK